jgi:hypothetical protein
VSFAMADLSIDVVFAHGSPGNTTPHRSTTRTTPRPATTVRHSTTSHPTTTLHPPAPPAARPRPHPRQRRGGRITLPYRDTTKCRR